MQWIFRLFAGRGALVPITHDELRALFLALIEGVQHMDATMQKLADDIAKQGALIDQLVAQKTANSDADVAKLQGDLDANNAKIIAALAPSPTV